MSKDEPRKILLEINQVVYLNSITSSFQATVVQRLPGKVILQVRSKKIRVPNPLPNGHSVQYGRTLYSVMTEPLETGRELGQRFETSKQIYYTLAELARLPGQPGQTLEALLSLHSGLQSLLRTQTNLRFHEPIP